MCSSRSKGYCPPAVDSTVRIVLESVLLGPSNDGSFEPLFVVDGHKTGGYYENDDIINDWD